MALLFNQAWLFYLLGIVFLIFLIYFFLYPLEVIGFFFTNSDQHHEKEDTENVFSVSYRPKIKIDLNNNTVEHSKPMPGDKTYLRNLEAGTEQYNVKEAGSNNYEGINEKIEDPFIPDDDKESNDMKINMEKARRSMMTLKADRQMRLTEMK